MSTSEKELSFDPSITLLTFQLCDHLSILNKQNSRKQHSDLSDRELECLRWAAAGKTSGEIATIVELSEHTVNHYLNSSCKKLDCVNRTQSVAKALRQNLI